MQRHLCASFDSRPSGPRLRMRGLGAVEERAGGSLVAAIPGCPSSGVRRARSDAVKGRSRPRCSLFSQPSSPMTDRTVPAAGGSLVVDIRSKVCRGVSAPLLAVENLRLSLEAGTFGAILGESGCGKSTVLRIVAGLDTEFDGQVHRPGGGRLGIVFQEPRLLPWRTVEENVRLALPGALSGRDLTPIFDALGLADHRDRHPGELSLGLARRAALARAFAVQPDLLLLDEPFVSLDARPCTTLMVTHDEEEVLALADRVFVFTPRPAPARRRHRAGPIAQRAHGGLARRPSHCPGALEGRRRDRSTLTRAAGLRRSMRAAPSRACSEGSVPSPCRGRRCAGTPCLRRRAPPRRRS